MTHTPARRYPLVITTALLVLAAILTVAATASLRWPYIHDSPLMLYAGWHLAQGGVPYRDLFDMNMPGTYFAMWALGAVFGWDDLGFRIFDLTCLATIGLATFSWLRRFGSAPAAAAALLFPLWYLAAGPSTSMQREFLALVPLTLALALTGSTWSAPVRFFGTGMLTGAAALIKPHFLLLALPPLVYQIGDSRRPALPWGLVAVMIAGAAFPFAAVFAFLAYRGGLDAFIDIANNYWPLYTHLSGTHETINGRERLEYLVTSTLRGLINPYVPLALVGIFAAVDHRSQRSLVWTIAGMIVAAAVYPSLSGQFWSYHWLPYHYVLLCAAALALVSVPPDRWTMRTVTHAAAATLTLTATALTSVSALVAATTGDHRSDVIKSRVRAEGVPSEVAAFLGARLQPGDAVQPLDWTGGAVHGMLEARAPLATRFMYDFHFYHHVDTPYIARLRRQFLRQLAAARPRFVIQVVDGRPWPTGPGTTHEFPQLREFLDSEYQVVSEGETYRILERIRGAGGK